jgi:hypothetical protein
MLPAKAPGQNSIGTGGQDSIGANIQRKYYDVHMPHLLSQIYLYFLNISYI